MQFRRMRRRRLSQWFCGFGASRGSEDAFLEGLVTIQFRVLRGRGGGGEDDCPYGLLMIQLRALKSTDGRGEHHCVDGH